MNYLKKGDYVRIKDDCDIFNHIKNTTGRVINITSSGYIVECIFKNPYPDFYNIPYEYISIIPYTLRKIRERKIDRIIDDKSEYSN